MPTFTACEKKFDVDLLVFDKDGLMFDSEQFWIEMADTRVSVLEKYCETATVLEWAAMMGANTVLKANDEPETSFVDPLGIISVASPFEEKIVTAGFLTGKLGLTWNEAKELAIQVFASADHDINLSKALKPQPGYVELMRRLIELGIPYGVATSDTYERTRDSMMLYSCWDEVRFVVTPEDVAQNKPAPDMLIYISKKTGVPLDRIAMIGDSYVDVKMANAAGSIGIGVSASAQMRDKMEPYASVVVSSLEELIF